MKLFIVSHKVAIGGGQEYVTKKIVDKCLQAGFKVHVICVETDLQPKSNLKLTKINLPKKPAALSFPLFVIVTSLLLAIFKRKSDISYSCGISSFWKIDFIGIHFCMSAFRSLNVTRQGYRASLMRRINMKIDCEIHVALERFAAKRFRGTYIPISKGLSSDLENFFEIPIKQIKVIPNGTTFVPVKFGRDGEIPSLRRRNLLFIGGDWGRKGLALLIESLSFVENWTLDVIGTGNIEDYRKLASEKGVDDRITFHGHKKDVTPFIRNSQFVILPSYYEGLPISLLEAISLGTPIIYTKINGSDELFGKFKPGILIDNNKIPTLVDTLRGSYHENTWRYMHNEAIKLAEEMDFENSLEKYVSLFRGAIK
jgi:glycosyltransferase involved in cell wall biosynthesis